MTSMTEQPNKETPPTADPNHPIWATIRTVATIIALTITLYVNASHFDSTELWTLGVIFIFLAGNESVSYVLSHLSPGKRQEKPE